MDGLHGELLRRRDWLLAAALVALGAAELALSERYQGRAAWPGTTPAGVVQVCVFAVPLAWRRSAALVSSLTVLGGAADDTAIALQWRDAQGEHTMTRTVGELRPLVLDTVHGRRIGFVTDLRYSEANIGQLVKLLADADRLYIESVFLDADREHAQRKNHLTARQAGEIARRVGAREVVPFHHSPRYEGRAAELQSEVRATWLG